jgi:single-strand DNA-binding protein
MATDDSWTDRSTGERQERTEWHSGVAWEKLAEICGQYLTKGRMVYIEGSIQSRQWEDQDGNKRTSFDIRARDMVMLGGPPGSSQGGGSSQEPASRPQEPSATDDDIPF